MPDSSRRTPSAWRRWLVTSLVAAAAAALIITGTTMVTASPEGATDLEGNAVELDPGTTPDPAVLEKMNPVDDVGDRFVVPSVGLNVPLGSLTMVDGDITPPGFTSAYTVRNLGVSPDDASDGTVFVVMHSLRGGGVGPGNALIDVDAERASVEPGAQVSIGDLTYTITGDMAITKAAIQSKASVWENTSGRLIIVTCLQRPEGGPSHENIVITAQLNP